MEEICLRDSAEGEAVGYVYGIFGLAWRLAVCLLCACGELCESLFLSLSLFFWRVRRREGGREGGREKSAAGLAKREDRKALNALAALIINLREKRLSGLLI